jgi:DNA repair protein RadC
MAGMSVREPAPIPLLRRAARGAIPVDPDRFDDGDAVDLLATVVGGVDPHRVARHVLAAAGGLAAAARMDREELEQIGLAPGRAVRLVAAFALGRRATTAWPRHGWVVRSPADVADRLLPEMGLLEREELRVLHLTTKNAVSGMRTVYVGNLAGSSVRVGELFIAAVRRCAAGIVVVHNHPSGDPAPSTEDLRITGEIAAAGALLDIGLLDHVVIGHGRWVSLRALGACG